MAQRTVEIQLHQTMRYHPNGDKRVFTIRKITGAISAATVNGRHFYVGDTLDEEQADKLTAARTNKVSVMADKS